MLKIEKVRLEIKKYIVEADELFSDVSIVNFFEQFGIFFEKSEKGAIDILINFDRINQMRTYTLSNNNTGNNNDN